MKKLPCKAKKINTVTIDIAEEVYRTHSPSRFGASDEEARDCFLAARNGMEEGWNSRNGGMMGSATAAPMQSGTCVSITGRSRVSGTTKGESSTTSCVSLHSYMAAAKGQSAATPRGHVGPKRPGHFRAPSDIKDSKQKKAKAQKKANQTHLPP